MIESMPVSPYEILVAYLNLLWSQLQFDIAVLSQPWMYWCLLVPAFAYSIFFFIKWGILTAPIWLPFNRAFTGIAAVYAPLKSIVKAAFKKENKKTKPLTL